jgi:hypothetical protein
MNWTGGSPARPARGGGSGGTSAASDEGAGAGAGAAAGASAAAGAGVTAATAEIPEGGVIGAASVAGGSASPKESWPLPSDSAPSDGRFTCCRSASRSGRDKRLRRPHRASEAASTLSSETAPGSGLALGEEGPADGASSAEAFARQYVALMEGLLFMLGTCAPAAAWSWMSRGISARASANLHTRSTADVSRRELRALGRKCGGPG